jgi:hypothetical protein
MPCIQAVPVKAKFHTTHEPYGVMRMNDSPITTETTHTTKEPPTLPTKEVTAVTEQVRTENFSLGEGGGGLTLR